MTRRVATVAGALAGILLAGSAAYPAGRWAPTCLQTLARAPDQFVDTFMERNEDASYRARRVAAEHWARCQHDANLKQLERTPALRVRILKVRELLNELLTLESDLAGSAGGNLYANARTWHQPYLEIDIARLIALHSASVGWLHLAAETGPQIEARQLRATEAMEARIRRLKAIKGPPPCIVCATPATWKALVAEYERTYRAIADIAGDRPTAVTVGIYEAAQPLWPDTIFDGFDAQQDGE
jgi:hypothetical protein